MVAFLLDEMYPPLAAEVLRDEHGRDAVHVAEVGLRATDDAEIARRARADGRAIVTENVADFAGEPEIALVIVLKKNLPSGGALAPALTVVLDRWAAANPEPYLGHHWPS